MLSNNYDILTFLRLAFLSPKQPRYSFELGQIIPCFLLLLTMLDSKLRANNRLLWKGNLLVKSIHLSDWPKDYGIGRKHQNGGQRSWSMLLGFDNKALCYYIALLYVGKQSQIVYRCPLLFQLSQIPVKVEKYEVSSAKQCGNQTICQQLAVSLTLVRFTESLWSLQLSKVNWFSCIICEGSWNTGNVLAG